MADVLRSFGLALASCILLQYIPKIYDFPSADVPRRPQIRQPVAEVRVEPVVSDGFWKKDPEVSWYGPGFYGKRTACGKAYTKEILGVAHRTLPCGTRVAFRYKGKVAIVPVIDRGPYVDGRQWDLSGGLCTYLKHCFTGPIEYRVIE